MNKLLKMSLLMLKNINGFWGMALAIVISVIWHLLFYRLISPAAPPGALTPLMKKILGTLFVFRLIANSLIGYALGSLYRRLQDLSTKDSLTGVYNRNCFFAQLERHLALARRYKNPLSLVMIDLDRFKDLNDSKGHLAGDRLLCDLATRLQKNLRQSDMLARFGGDEFILLLPNTTKKGAFQLMQRIERSLMATLNQSGVTLSMGVASYPEDGESCEELLDQADKAMYQVKKQRKIKGIQELL